MIETEHKPRSNPAHESEDWLLFQLTDSALPTGGFIASAGLEVAVQTQHVNSIPTLLSFLKPNIDSYGQSAGIVVNHVLDLLDDPNSEEVVKRLEEADKFYDAMTSNHVAKRASRAQGSAYLALMAKSFKREEDGLYSVLAEYKRHVRARTSPGNLPICFALSCKCLSLSREKTLHLFLFLHARSLVSAAVRLNLVGPYQGQSILADLRPEVSRVLNKIRGRTLEDACSTAPVLDVLQGLHDRLYSRLFNS